MILERLRGRCGQRGSIAPLVPVMGLIMLLLGGLVIDSARLLSTRSRAVAYAEEAARAGAASVDLGQRVLGLDPGTVALNVKGYCDSLEADPDTASSVVYCGLDSEGDPGSSIEVVDDDDQRRLVVRTRVEMKMKTTLLGMVGVQDLESRGIGRARAFEGVDITDVDSTPPPVSFEPVQPPLDPPGDVTAPSAPPELPPCPSPTPTPTTAPAPQPGDPRATPTPSRRPGQPSQPGRPTRPAVPAVPTCQPVTPGPTR